jgi:hypothetical protein
MAKKFICLTAFMGFEREKKFPGLEEGTHVVPVKVRKVEIDCDEILMLEYPEEARDPFRCIVTMKHGSVTFNAMETREEIHTLMGQEVFFAELVKEPAAQS